MKAKEYFEKYEQGIMFPDTKGTTCPLNEMVMAFQAEMKEIIEKRHIRLDSGVINAIREQNQKWNAVVNMFVKKYGESPILRDAFEKFTNKLLEINEKEEEPTEKGEEAN